MKMTNDYGAIYSALCLFDDMISDSNVELRIPDNSYLKMLIGNLPEKGDEDRIRMLLGVINTLIGFAEVEIIEHYDYCECSGFLNGQIDE